MSLDDQPEINEYIKYQRTIRELKDENTHLRDEMANLRKSMKSDKKQVEIQISTIDFIYFRNLVSTRRRYHSNRTNVFRANNKISSRI